jgi:conjugal transfer pilus assembly protein TraL
MNHSYRFFKHIDDPWRPLGFTVDELVPAMLIFVSLFWSSTTFALLGAMGSVVAIKKLKKGRGAEWVLGLVYWHLPHFLLGSLFKATPPSFKRVYRR